MTFGSPVRGGVGLVSAAIIIWLGAISVGAAAVVAMVVLLALFWGLPYGWAGRLRLVIDDNGITDVSRFRRFHHPWDDGLLGWERVGGHTTVVLRLPGNPDPVWLLAGWCPNRRTAEAVLATFANQGWPVEHHQN